MTPISTHLNTVYPLGGAQGCFQGEAAQSEVRQTQGTSWINAVNASEDQLKELLKTGRPLRFDWENKWLRGDQYSHMLNNIDAYGQAFGMQKLAEK